ncbi:MAG: copper amine oxidase N-terminal domain-containing protein [Candidatus Eremiobacteraeota bacterium]|nr:copper amine oxidase N-terminal domain-containing protein [Candidatus Eremiobacteraeota bacterium]MBC5802162.1 copper amine oxidase N-terminal domain-containing protein [Candidatus Eremiobacteraeota bacterium]MBC5821786.1 copper amine oxidase N-terminal domain-containing protein [Candidatus Eremiobacteraeota bacterium]
MSSHRIAAFVVACLFCAAPVAAARHEKVPTRAARAASARKPGPAGGKAHPVAAEKPTRTIAVAVNGEPLPGGVSAEVQDGRVLVPLREVFAALGLDIERSGNQIRSRLPTGTVRFTLGSAQASVDERSIALDADVQTLHGTTYVPLRLLSAALGAQATYDQRGAQVEIVSSLFGRMSGTERQRADGGVDVQGVISAIDRDSVPPSLTVVRGGTARTIAVTSNAKIWTEDVTIHTQLPGAFTDLRVGDALHAILARDGRVVSLFDYFRSTSGTIAATAPNALVLADGRVVDPSSATTITLGAAPAQLGDLRIGDYVTVRSNPESGELRSIVASRKGGVTAPGGVASATPGAPSNVTISSVALSAQRPLRAGEHFDVTLKGTPGGRAAFDIGDYLTNLPMRETTPGDYAGRFTIPERFNLTDVPVYGTLSVGGVPAQRVQAPQTLSATTTPPTIAEVAPTPGQTVNNPRPSIFATYEAPTSIAINTGTVRLVVNGHDVTSSATRMGGFIVYSPGVDLGNGPVSVVVRVSDAAGNTAAKTWTFTVRS